LLRAYGIAAPEHPLLGSIEASIRGADELGYPVDLALVLTGAGEQELLARELRSPADIQIAARGLRGGARARYPGSRVSGYRLRPSAARSGVTALRLGVADDTVFGPVIFLGPAGAAATREHGVVVGLPPLNPLLARDLLARGGFAEQLPEADRAALESTLVRLSQLLMDIEQVVSVELDPLHVETASVRVHEVRIGLEKRAGRAGLRRFAIRPYPRELERSLEWRGRQVLIRPIRPEDEPALGDLIGSLDAQDSRMRFFGAMRTLPRSQLARFTQIDYDREMALVAIERGADGVERSLGEARTVADPDNRVADFAIVVRSELKGMGLGRLLLQAIIDYSRGRGTAELRGETLAGNLRMQHLARQLGFALTTGADAGTLDLRLPLRQPPA
jgi:acetyltransferase